ncbi:unnamed protein product [Calicophoron daubneyi]|uniref:Uncharacterized protein n=1 Tax=Calicophoron daubneyi TaxID=300641 RepID=A0AAV2TX77_CALDB
MYSRRRFSSHPADCNRREVDPSLSADDCPHLLFSSPSDSSRLSTPSCPEPSEMLGGCCGIQGRRAVCIPPTSGSSLILQQSRWRQSAPQLVTLSPMPMSLKELHEFLQRRSSYRVTSVDRSSTKAEEESHACDVRIDGADVTVASCHMDGEAVERDFEGVPDEGSGKRPELCVISEVQTPGHRVRNKFSESSNTDSGCSEQPLSSRSCSRCGLSLDSTDGLPPVGAVGGRILRQPSCPTSSRLLPIGSAPQAGDPSGYLRRRRRLPSSWSTTVSSSTVNPPESDENPPQSAQNCTEQPVSAQGRQPQFARSLSSGNSPPCSLTPLLPTSSVVPGSQYFTRRRHHTASACEASTFQNKYSSFDQACSSSLPNGAEVDAIRSISAKSSLVSLSSNSIPHWADAPTQAKPRTGFNYVSREFVTALHAQRKLTHQQQVLPPPSSGGRHTDGFGQATSSQTSAPPPSLPYVQPHPCTPVPEAARESEESGSSGHFFSSDATMTSRITTDPDHPTGVRDGLEIRVDPAVVRSYVNVGPTARRLGLQPINEHEAVDPLRSVSTQPLTRRELITESPASAQSGNRTSLISGLFTPTDTTNVSATTLDSYVNLAEYPGTLGGGSLPGIVLHNSSKGAVSTAQQYINLIPLALTSVRGFRGLSPPSVGSLSVHAPLASSDGGSSNFESNMSTVSAGTTTLNPPLLASGPCHPQIPLANDGTSHILPKQIPPSESLNAVTPGTEGHLNGVPRLHYAHLTLSNEKAWRTPSGMSTQAASEVDTTLVQSTSSVTVGSLLYTNRNRQTVQNKLQGPNSDDLGSSTVVPANTAYNSTVATSIVGQSSSSGVNYVTIDMVQTKALSELEQELRLVSAEGSMKSLSQQQSMGSNLRSASSNRNTMAEKGRGFDQDTKSGPWRGGNFDNRRNTSFASRLFTRLAHSFSFRHSHSNRSSKKDKQLDETTSCGSRLKRSYTTTGADHATASSVTASTTANSSPVR